MKFIHFLSIFLLFACNSDDLELAFRMEYPNRLFEIRAGLNPFESHYFIQTDIATNKDFFFGDYTTADITEISPLFARITSMEGTSINYGFIEEVSVRICSEQIYTQNDAIEKCTREIFYRDDIPINTGSEFELIPNGLNVKSLLTQADFGIVVVLRRLRDFPPTSINTRLDMGFQARR